MLPGNLAPAIVVRAKEVAANHLRSQGNIIEPVLIYRKGDVIHEPALIRLPTKILGTEEIRSLVVAAYTMFVMKAAPDEVAFLHQGVFWGDGEPWDCLRIIYSMPSFDRTFVTPLFSREIGAWQEIVVRSGELYRIFDRAFAPWN